MVPAYAGMTVGGGRNPRTVIPAPAGTRPTATPAPIPPPLRPLPSFLRRQEPLPHLFTTPFPNPPHLLLPHPSPSSPIHPSPLLGGRLGGGWEAPSVDQRSCRRSGFLRVIPAHPFSVIPTPPPSSPRPPPPFLRRQEWGRPAGAHSCLRRNDGIWCGNGERRVRRRGGAWRPLATSHPPPNLPPKRGEGLNWGREKSGM